MKVLSREITATDKSELPSDNSKILPKDMS